MESNRRVVMSVDDFRDLIRRTMTEVIHRVALEKDAVIDERTRQRDEAIKLAVQFGAAHAIDRATILGEVQSLNAAVRAPKVKRVFRNNVTGLIDRVEETTERQ